MAEADPYRRIETALDRIDAALKRPDTALEQLKLRHSRLRARVEDAVAALDLLASPSPEVDGDDTGGEAGED